MAHDLTTLLKRARDNYYLSLLLASAAKPLHFVSTRAALCLEQKVRRNGTSIRLPNGTNMAIARDSGVGIASALFWHGLDGYEPETSRTLRFFFERAATFVDVGANCGLYSLLGALWNPGLQVVAFEPVPAIFEGLKRNVLLNQLVGRVRCENVALSSQTGRTAFFLPKSEGGRDVESTGTLARESWQVRKGAAQIEVETVRFDEYTARHPMRVDLIKIDVEDFEADVLEGMKGVIARDRPFVVCEVLPRLHGNQRTRKIVEGLNYQPYWITPAGYVKVPKFDFGRGNLTDFLLSPVATPDVVLDGLDGLWESKERSCQQDRIAL
ncbi:MAG: FkbM family methyltransferase [Terriglobales bacterium]